MSLAIITVWAVLAILLANFSSVKTYDNVLIGQCRNGDVFVRSIPQEAKIWGNDTQEHDEFGASVSIDGTYMVIGAPENDGRSGKDTGAAYIFRNNGTQWIQEAKIQGHDTQEGDQFGASVSIDGTYMVIGAPENDGRSGKDTGAAYIFRNNGTQWIQEAKIQGHDTQEGDQFGASVSIDGTYVVIGAPENDGRSGKDTGAAYIFRNNGTQWIQEAKIQGHDTQEGDQFGASVSIDGTYMVIGAPRNDGRSGKDTGAAYIFRNNGTQWIQEAKIRGDDTIQHNHFGESVSIHKKHVIIGARGENRKDNNTGAAYIFRRDGTQWIQEASVQENNPAENDWFGTSVSIHNTYAAVGAVGKDIGGINTGVVYVFRRDGTQWIQEAKIKGKDTTAQDDFGNSVAIGESSIVVGAQRNRNIKNDAGSVYAFNITDAPHERTLIKDDECGNGICDKGKCVECTKNSHCKDKICEDNKCITTCASIPINNHCYNGDVFVRSMPQEAKIQGHDTQEGDQFGASVSIDGTYMVIGAPENDGRSGKDTGAAYIFRNNGTQWIQEAKIQGHDTQEGDQFGASVSIDGTYMVIGAPENDGRSGKDTGAAYIFRNNGTQWIQEAKIQGHDTQEGDQFGASVSIDGTYMVIGAPENDGRSGKDTGAAYIFRNNGTQWIQEAKIQGHDTQEGDQFGASVSIDGTYMVIGAPENDGRSGKDTGAAYIFRNNGTQWIQEAKIQGHDTQEGDQFGASVSIDGTYVVIGAPWEDIPGGIKTNDTGGMNAGAAYIFRNNGTQWIQEAKIQANDKDSWDLFGKSIKIKEDRIIVGARYEDTRNTNAGAAYIFRNNGTQWIQEAKIHNDKKAAYNEFGAGVSISEKKAVVTAVYNNDVVYGQNEVQKTTHKRDWAYIFDLNSITNLCTRIKTKECGSNMCSKGVC